MCTSFTLVENLTNELNIYLYKSFLLFDSKMQHTRNDITTGLIRAEQSVCDLFEHCMIGSFTYLIT